MLADHGATGHRIVAEEIAVALTYQGATYAVMMATPEALDDFALGFSLTEGIIRDPAEVREIDIVPRPQGIELRLTLSTARQEVFERRRRRLLGALGCGLCGIESLDAAMRPSPQVRSSLRLAASEIPLAMAALDRAQALHRLTHSVHAAGFWLPAQGLVALREDVGRHNALDKLGDALAQGGFDPSRGAILLTSRVSVEMVQKAAMLGAPVVVAISAPTALAIRTAEACGITLVCVARGESFEVFSHPARIAGFDEVDGHLEPGWDGLAKA